jgi:glutamate racemase
MGQDRLERSAKEGRPRLGVFDSGVGGLTVVAALRRRLPGADLLFLGDTARLPYGTKSPETVARYTRNNIRFLVQNGVDAVVVACNTASATGLDNLRVGIPVWGVIAPGARLAAERSRGRLGIIATESTVRSGAYPRAVAALDRSLHVVCQAAPLLVPLVEEGWLDDSITRQVIERYVVPLREAQIDTLLLGCTHYPLLAPLIQRVMGDAVTVVDSAEAVSHEVARQWQPAPSAGGARGHLEVLVTDGGDRFATMAQRILGEPVQLSIVDVDASSLPEDRDTPRQALPSQIATGESG